jgi:hypothetical protein
MEEVGIRVCHTPSCARCSGVTIPKKCLRMPKEQLPLEDLYAKEDLSYQEYPVKILGTLERVTRNKKFKLCKVQWSHHTEEEATWKREEELKAEFPSFFSNLSESQG